MYIVFLTILILIIVSAGIYLKMYPRFPRIMEKFSSPAVAPYSPKCINRSVAAQNILMFFKPCPFVSPTEDATDREELALILQKLTCLESDVANNGVTGYNTFNLQYNTSHDTEPLTNFVGRCLNNGANSRDINIIMDKYETRGKELIRRISGRIGIASKEWLLVYESVLKVTNKTLNLTCLSQHSSLDIPYGPRDPGYAVPSGVATLAPY